MNDLISSFVGNLHIVRRIGAGIIFLALVIGALHGEARDFTDDKFLNFVKDNSILVTTSVVLIAYLTGSLIEFIGTKIILVMASVLTCAFQKPLNQFAWIPNPLRIIICLFWWFFIGVFALLYYFFALVSGSHRFKFNLEENLDQESMGAFRNLRESVRFGLSHPNSMHFNHAIDEVFSKSGERKVSLERTLNRDEDITAFVSALILGAIAFVVVNSLFGQADPDAAFVEELFFVFVIYAIFILSMAAAVMFLSIKKGMVVSAIETMTSNGIDGQDKPKAKDILYQVKRYSKAGRYVFLAFVTMMSFHLVMSIVGGIFQETINYQIFDRLGAVAPIEDTAGALVGEPEVTGEEPLIAESPAVEADIIVDPDPLEIFQDWMNWLWSNIRWAGVLGLAIFSYVYVFKPNIESCYSDNTKRAVVAGLVFAFFYLVIEGVFSAIPKYFSWNGLFIANIIYSLSYAGGLVISATAAFVAAERGLTSLFYKASWPPLNFLSGPFIIIFVVEVTSRLLVDRVIGVYLQGIEFNSFSGLIYELGDFLGIIFALAYLLGKNKNISKRRLIIILKSIGLILLLYLVVVQITIPGESIGLSGLNYSAGSFNFQLGTIIYQTFFLYFIFRLVEAIRHRKALD